MNISFTPSGFEIGRSYYAELLKENIVFEKTENLINGQTINYNIIVPGTYEVRVVQVGGSCINTQTIQALFPLVEYNESGVDCNNNTYTFSITLTNPTTSGSNIQYGFSFANNCSSVLNWNTTSTFLVPADDVIRYFFVKNDSSCCTPITPTVKSPCNQCTLQVSGVIFNCN